ncbi:MAG: tetratricopeptide repeat protein [Paracoccaceae bacterium]|nr:tetratricopeptide repeat protein [Paracoccaceae bacterium]
MLSQYEEILPRYLITLAQGWTEIANDSLKKGIERFSSLDGTNRHLGSYNCAVAFAIAGDFQNALLYLEELEDQNLKFDELQLQALVQIYSNNNLNNKAITLLESRNKDQNSGTFNKVVLDLKNGNRLKFNAFRTPADALANVFYLMGSTSANAKKNPRSSGFYIQLAELLSSDKDYYNMRLGEIFRDMRTFNYSIEKFNKVRDESIFYSRAQLGVADTLVRSGRSNLAQEILEQLIEDGFNEFVIFDALADIFRVKEDYERAIYYYDMALKNITEDAKHTKWSTFFVRGIAYDQFGNWERAKVDLRNALELSSNHPEVLNYFGYSLIERNESLEKALKMIENAVSQRPESGYIIDSLAWGLFRLGHYKEAILPMERAVQLEPHDPIVNDHLGDILWMIGRKREATFQWQRALFFGPTAENEKEIKKKLKFGITDSYNSD